MIWRLKTDHAVQLIRATGLTLAEIADQCGFSNAFHLSRCVKERTGTAPRDLRKTTQEG
jgi:transcriptional regulator GlxA family with amidase domain